MNIFTKTLVGSWMLLSLILWYSLTFWESKDIPQERNAQERVNYDEAEKMAQRYLEMNKYDDLWENNSPRLWEATPLFMEKEIPSYVEYSVSCERNSQCWFIVVNIDGDDVDIPVASPSDIPPSQRLLDKSWAEKQELQFYYFGPFDIYSKNQITGQINAIDPQKDPIEEEDDNLKDLTPEEREQVLKMITEKQEQLPENFKKQFDFWQKYKLSQEFQQAKKYIEDYDFTSTAFPESVDVWNWKYVKTYNSSPGCSSRVPCYKQYNYFYKWWWCDSWCSPVAAAIIFGYHDRVGNYPNLLPNYVAPVTNSKNSPIQIVDMIDNIRSYMGTFCVSGTWLTTPDGMVNAVNFLRHHVGYAYAQSWAVYGHQWPTSMKIFEEISEGRPLMLNMHQIGVSQPEWHSVVVYWYQKVSTNDLIHTVRINAGWGNNNDSNTAINLINITNLQFDPNDNSVKTTHSVVWYNINPYE